MQALRKLKEALASIHLTRDLTLDQVETHLRLGLGLHDNGHLVLAFYLADMAERGLHQEARFTSAAAYAEEVLGLDVRRARELVSVGRKLLVLPAILEAHRRQRIGWSKVLQLVKVASPEHEDAWLAFALEHTCRELTLEVRLTKPGHAPRGAGHRKGLREVRFSLRARVPVLTHKKLSLAQEKLEAERGGPVTQGECIDALADLFLTTDDDGTVPGRQPIDSSLYRIVVRPDEAAPPDGREPGLVVYEDDLGYVPIDRVSDDGERDDGRSACLRCDAQAVYATDDVSSGVKDKATSKALRRRVLARDDHRCRACGGRHCLHVHHIKFRTHGGRTLIVNLISLCEHCHALVHGGLLVLVGETADEITFADAKGRVLGSGAQHVEPHVIFSLGQGKGLHVPGAPAPERPAPPPEPVPFDEAFARVVGQPALLSRLHATAAGSQARGRPFPHTLFTGPPGTGKTTLAEGLAAALGARLVRTAGPLLQRPGEIVRILASLGQGDVLFLDEIHAVPRPVLETLYEAMDAFPSFTLVAATTEGGDLPDALLSRFGLRESLGYYETEDLAALVVARARAEGVALHRGAAERLAAYARGTPREALRLLERVLDEAARGRRTSAACELVDRVLRDLGYDDEGLAPDERRYLAVLRESRTPVPLWRLARMLGASAASVARLLEPYLFRMGWVQMTPRGRLASPRLLRQLS